MARYLGFGCLVSDTDLCSGYLAHGMQAYLGFYYVCVYAVIPINLHLVWKQMTLVFVDLYALLL